MFVSSLSSKKDVLEREQCFNELESSIMNLTLDHSAQKANSLGKKVDKPAKDSKFGLFKRRKDFYTQVTM